MITESHKEQFGNYSYGLSPEEEARAAKLHEESIIIDMLYWGPCSYLSCTSKIEKQLDEMNTHDPIWGGIMNFFYPQHYAVRGKFPEFKKCWDVSGVTAGSRMVDFSSWERFASMFGKHIAMCDNFPWVIKALCADDIRRAKAEGKHAIWLTTQVAYGICQNFIDLIEPAYELGLRMIQLTYNWMNLIGAGCTERTDAGVSTYGAKVIALMNELGIIVDTGHCGRQTTLDACALSTKPVVASHTAAEGIYKHARSKSDEELRAIADTGGVIGVLAIPCMIAPPPSPGEKAGMEVMLDHIDYVANLVGWEHVGIGTDWPLPMPKSILKKFHIADAYKRGHRKEDRIDEIDTNLDGFDDYRDFPNVSRGLVKRGYPDEQIKGILGENVLHVFKEACG